MSSHAVQEGPTRAFSARFLRFAGVEEREVDEELIDGATGLRRPASRRTGYWKRRSSPKREIRLMGAVTK